MSAGSLSARAELLAELGITSALQGRFDRIAKDLRAARAELEEALEACEPDTDTETRCAEALGSLDDVLYRLEWKAPDPGGHAPS